jgi:hypothetical protein
MKQIAYVSPEMGSPGSHLALEYIFLNLQIRNSSPGAILTFEQILKFLWSWVEHYN